MRTYKQTIPAGGQITLGTQGRFFMLMKATGNVDIDFIGAGNTTIGQAIDVGASFKGTLPKVFEHVKITDVSGADNSVQIGVGEEWADYGKVLTEITGTVKVDQVPSIPNPVFANSLGTTAGAGTYSTVSYTNPPDSTKIAYIRRVNVWGSASDINNISIGKSNIPLGSPWSEKAVNDQSTASALYFRHSDDPDHFTNLHVSDPDLNSRLARVQNRPSGEHNLVYNTPIELLPGASIVFWSASAGAFLGCSIEWEERNA